MEENKGVVEYKIGDIVFLEKRGEGEIVSINNRLIYKYPIKVLFHDGEWDTFTIKGHRFKDCNDPKNHLVFVRRPSYIPWIFKVIRKVRLLFLK